MDRSDLQRNVTPKEQRARYSVVDRLSTKIDLVILLEDQLIAKDAEIERLQDALQKIKQWAEAYPKDVFTEQDLKLADKVLKAAGISMTGMNGTFARHLTSGIGKIATKALANV